LAGELAIAESTLRTRWLPWLERVAPVELLKTVGGTLAQFALDDLGQLCAPVRGLCARRAPIVRLWVLHLCNSIMVNLYNP
jgi:hypothetical protein